MRLQCFIRLPALIWNFLTLKSKQQPLCGIVYILFKIFYSSRSCDEVLIMATSETVDRTAVSGARLSIQEEPAEEHLVQTPDRRHVDDLLDISEEDFLKELEPHENYSYCGWDEAVSTNLSANCLAYTWL